MLKISISKIFTDGKSKLDRVRPKYGPGCFPISILCRRSGNFDYRHGWHRHQFGCVVHLNEKTGKITNLIYIGLD